MQPRNDHSGKQIAEREFNVHLPDIRALLLMRESHLTMRQSLTHLNWIGATIANWQLPH